MIDKTPTSNWGKFVFFFCIQFLSYGVLVANGRAYVQGSYTWTAITDAMFASLNFLLIRRLAKDAGDNIHGLSMAGYVLGGIAGSLFAIYITKIVYGQ